MGAAHKAFNQQLTEDQWVEVNEQIWKILGDFRPYVTTFREMKKGGWHKIYKSSNEYISVYVDSPKNNHERQHDAWSRLNNSKKKALVEYISSCKYLDTSAALRVLEEITGIKGEENSESKQKAKALREKADELLKQATELEQSL